MLTYQLQTRGFRMHSDARLEFPNSVELEFIMEPREPFGASAKPGKTVVGGDGRKVEPQFNRHTGRLTFQNFPPLEQVETIVDLLGWNIVIRGNKVSLRTMCNNRRELSETLATLYYFFPILLNIELDDASVITQISGAVGKTRFDWVVVEGTTSFTTTSKEIQESKISGSLQKLQLFSGTSNRRVAAALHYFHIACRLVAVGSTPWEFTAE